MYKQIIYNHMYREYYFGGGGMNKKNSAAVICPKCYSSSHLLELGTTEIKNFGKDRLCKKIYTDGVEIIKEITHMCKSCFNEFKTRDPRESSSNCSDCTEKKCKYRL